MAEPAEDQEPSMEEILASIRRIISEDSPAEAPADAEHEEQVLELTEIVPEEPPPVPEPPRARDALPPEPSYAMPILRHDDGVPPVDTSLVSEETAEASMSSFAAVAAEARRRLVRAQPVGDGTATLEGIVRDLLRPMLKEWLDDNLPELVSRLVEEEISRLAQRAK